MKMEILLEPTLNKLMVEHAEFDESDTYVLERFDTSAGNPVNEILLKLNLPDHRIFKDGGEERYEHVGPEVTSSRDDKVYKMAKQDYAWLMISRCSRLHSSQDKGTSSHQKSMITTSNHKLMIEVNDYNLKTKVKALSTLPDDLIHQTLSFNDTLDAIKTSILSSILRFIWTTMTCLAFSSEDFPDMRKFSKFVKHVLSGRDNQREVSSMKLSFRGKASQVFVRRILDYALFQNAQQLDIKCLVETMVLMFYRSRNSPVTEGKSLKDQAKKHVSSSVEIISHQPSPFANLKSLKIYPKEWWLPKITMFIEVKNYLLDGSLGATFTMVSRKEIIAEKNAKKCMAILQVHLEREKAGIATIRGHIEVENVPMESRNALICWESLSEQIKEGKNKIDTIIHQLRIIRNYLNELPASKMAKIRPCFSSLCAQADNIMIVFLANFATTCALALGAEKLICIIDGPIFYEWGLLIRFLTLKDVDILIRRRAQQSKVAANYVKAIGEESNSNFRGYNDFNEGALALHNGTTSSYIRIATFQNGVGFDNGILLLEDKRGSVNQMVIYVATFVCRVVMIGWLESGNHFCGKWTSHRLTLIDEKQATIRAIKSWDERIYSYNIVMQ
ncbi:F-box domain containing protein [Tanacetum coccineum]